MEGAIAYIPKIGLFGGFIGGRRSNVTFLCSVHILAVLRIIKPNSKMPGKYSTTTQNCADCTILWRCTELTRFDGDAELSLGDGKKSRNRTFLCSLHLLEVLRLVGMKIGEKPRRPWRRPPARFNPR
jgi:hypothetical protein